jgi:hypothetical protein
LAADTLHCAATLDCVVNMVVDPVKLPVTVAVMGTGVVYKTAGVTFCNPPIKPYTVSVFMPLEFPPAGTVIDPLSVDVAPDPSPQTVVCARVV